MNQLPMDSTTSILVTKYVTSCVIFVCTMFRIGALLNSMDAMVWDKEKLALRK